MLRKDSLKLGLLLGFLAPLLGLLAYYFAKFSLFTFKEFVGVVLAQKTLLTAMVSVSLVLNAAIFTYFINTRKDRTAKGIFIATCTYAIAALLWKFFS
jgi:NADH:ubiquinone oxidoreductase subunit K